MHVRGPAYSEIVVASRWVNALAVVLGAGAGAGIAAMWRDGGASDGARGPSTVALAVVAVVLLLAWRWFGRLHVDVDERALRFRFGPLRCTLDAARIARVSPEPYRWWRFGGWGWRFARVERRVVRAYSVPFVRSGVAVDTTDGRRYYISSRAPEALAYAVRALSERHAQ